MGKFVDGWNAEVTVQCPEYSAKYWDVAVNEYRGVLKGFGELEEL